MITNLPPPGGVSPTSDAGGQPDSFSAYEAEEFQHPGPAVPHQGGAPHPGYPQYAGGQQGAYAPQHYQVGAGGYPGNPGNPPGGYPGGVAWQQQGYYQGAGGHAHPHPYGGYQYGDGAYHTQMGYGGQHHPHHVNGYYDQTGHHHPPGSIQGGTQQGSHNCSPSPLANSDDSGGDCVNEAKKLVGGATSILDLIPRPKGPRPTTSVMSAKRGGKRARQRDPNEPQKPVSAYALFFRDVQAGIKARNPAASFGEVSKHVAALWDQMDADSKGAYKRRTEQAKKEYLRQLAAYRATLVSKGNSIDSPYNGKGLLGAGSDVTKPDERPAYALMGQRMADGYHPPGSGGTLTATGAGSPSSPQGSTLGPPNNNGYPPHPHHLAMRQHHMAPQHERYSYGDPYATHADEPAGMGMAQCKRSGCPNMVRVMSNNNGRPMPEYCSNDCLVNNNKHQLTNPYAATSSSGNTMNNTPPSSVNNTTSATPTTPTWSPPEQHSSSTTTPPPSQQQQPPK